MAGTITTLADFRDYIKRRLGAPVICIEVADEQIDEIIYDSVQTMQRYLYGEAQITDYITIPITSGVSAYSLSGTDIEDVVDFQLSVNTDGINTLHSNTNALLFNDWVMNGNYPGSVTNYGQGMTLAGYDIAMMYLEEVNMHFKRTYHASYDSMNQVIRIIPTPTANDVGFMQVWKKQNTIKLYNHPHTKKLARALTMQQWGLHLTKYSIQLPGGGTANGSDILQQGIAMEEEVMQRIENEGEQPEFWVA